MLRFVFVYFSLRHSKGNRLGWLSFYCVTCRWWVLPNMAFSDIKFNLLYFLPILKKYNFLHQSLTFINKGKNCFLCIYFWSFQFSRYLDRIEEWLYWFSMPGKWRQTHFLERNCTKNGCFCLVTRNNIVFYVFDRKWNDFLMKISKVHV